MTAPLNDCDKRPVSADTAPSPASDPRGELFKKLTKLAIGAGPGDGSMHVAEIDASLANLVCTVTPATREKVAQSIAPANLPLPNLVGTLARDEIAVARPILRTSSALSDDVLIAVARDAGPEHRLEIAGRHGLSEDVTQQLVAADELDLIEAVASNGTAALSPQTLDKMARASEASSSLSAKLLERPDLPVLSAHRMFWWVTGPLRELILKSHVVDVRDVRRLLTESLNAGLIDALSSEQIDRVLANMMRHTRPPTNDLVSILRRGSMPAFVEALQSALGVNEETARRIAEDNGGEAVAVACRALDADRGQFTSIFLQLDFLRFGKARPTARLAQISSIYDRVSRGRAAASVLMWTVLAQD